MDGYDPPLVHLPGTRLTPEVLLHRTLNKLPRIKAIAMVIQWDDDTMDVDHSSMQVSTLQMTAAMLRVTADRTMMGEQ